jgi:cytochrome b
VTQLKLQKIWDPVTRLWHWVLALLVILNWVFGEFMSFDTVVWHFYLGYAVLGLLAYRILWGVVGPQNVRWKSLFSGPREIMKYLAKISHREPSGTPGHNPVGSLSVLALIVVLLGQGVTGLFIESDDFFESGPLVGYVSEDVISRMTWLHHQFAEVLLVLVVLHLAAIVFYRIWKRENLVKPMISGWKWVRVETSESPENSSDVDLK